MRTLSHLDQIAFADLCSKAFDGKSDRRFPENGNFVKQKRGRREYFYYKGYKRAVEDAPGKHSLTYVGPVDDEKVRGLVENFGRDKGFYRIRRELIAKLRRSGLPAPTPIEGRILEAFSSADAWNSVVLVGTLAYQTYSGPLGVLLDEAEYRTQDADFAEFFLPPGREMIDLPGLLEGIDPTFEPVFHPSESSIPVGFCNSTGYKVELLVPPGRARTSVYPSRVMRTMGAQVLKFLDFLVKEPIRSVALYDGGVPVVVPAPERYAVHKLIVACLRASHDRARIAKDIAQCSAIIEAKRLAGATVDLGMAWTEAHDRGPRWRRHLALGAERLSGDRKAILEDGIRRIARIECRDPGPYIPWLDPADDRPTDETGAGPEP
ncbi:GSU2403 family nucleotidyltransferase fold protein [Methylobacterium oryzisoli]|uniref:GSU2403 family nucleotidyltransferase fold protein n=1 Tax=Methylobacterium oryzisoli TaxID=3385502 RepID=UPI003891300F